VKLDQNFVPSAQYAMTVTLEAMPCRTSEYIRSISDMSVS